jgi:small subunit ribosomal protein S1
LSSEINSGIYNMQDLLDGSYVPRVRKGELVSGILVKLGQEGMLVSIGQKSEGIVPTTEMRSLKEDDIAALKAGDEILTRVLDPESPDGTCILSLDQARLELGWKKLKGHFDNNQPVSGRIIALNKGGLLIDVEGARGFIPMSHVGGQPKKQTNLANNAVEDRIGESIDVKVIELDQLKNRLILSEKLIINEQKAHERSRALQEIEEGETRKGIVTGISTFGVFVDIGGIDGLVHISELSWDMVKKPSDIVQIDDQVEVYVMKVDKDAEKISLSLRRITPEPWQTAGEKYQVNQEVTGVITNITDFGAFARLEGSIEGLIHISELSYQTVRHPKDVVKEGDIVSLKVLTIEPERKRLALSLRQAEEGYQININKGTPAKR